MSCRLRLERRFISCRSMMIGGRIVRMGVGRLGWFRWSVWLVEAPREVLGGILGVAVLFFPPSNLLQELRVGCNLSCLLIAQTDVFFFCSCNSTGLDFLSLSLASTLARITLSWYRGQYSSCCRASSRVIVCFFSSGSQRC